MRENIHVRFSQLEKTFPTPKGPLCVVKGFELEMIKGEFVTLIGHSGCGKSTVLSILAGLQRASLGGVILAGKEVDEPGPDRGIVFQSPCLLPWMSALGNVMLGVQQVYPKRSKEEQSHIATYYLKLVGLGGDLHKMPAELSQGMRQRVGIADSIAAGTHPALGT
jgi:nitrate/nitrite transport system ATP-binding protein